MLHKRRLISNKTCQYRNAKAIVCPSESTDNFTFQKLLMFCSQILCYLLVSAYAFIIWSPSTFQNLDLIFFIIWLINGCILIYNLAYNIFIIWWVKWSAFRLVRFCSKYNINMQIVAGGVIFLPIHAWCRLICQKMSNSNNHRVHHSVCVTHSLSMHKYIVLQLYYSASKEIFKSEHFYVNIYCRPKLIYLVCAQIASA